MELIKGKCNEAKVFTSIVEPSCLEQVELFCSYEYLRGEKIRIMPDCHTGKGVCIGFTSTFSDKLDPSTVGCDIACGILVYELGQVDIDLNLFDKACHNAIRAGNTIYKKLEPVSFDADELSAKLDTLHIEFDKERELRSVGTLGSGNHFVELDKDESGNVYLAIHSGSRHLGLDVESHYSALAAARCDQKLMSARKGLIDRMRAENRRDELHGLLKAFVVPEMEQYIEGDVLDDYISDMRVMNEYANLNRHEMAYRLLNYVGIDPKSCVEWTTSHNYVDTENKIIRKGAVSAHSGEKLIIPMNMRDGSLICVGKGNDDWNESAPHGSGRLMSRQTARDTLNLNDFIESMKGIKSSTVCQGTIDEAPMAYKPTESIIECIKDTVEIQNVIKPIYNFKAR